MKGFKLVLIRFFIFINILVLAAYAGLIVTNRILFPTQKELAIASRQKDDLLFATMSKYASEDIAYNEIPIYHAGISIRMSDFCIENSSKWMLRIPRYAGTDNIAKTLGLIHRHLKNPDKLLIVINVADRKAGDAFVKQYQVEEGTVFFTFGDFSSIRQEEGRWPFFQQINSQSVTDNIVPVTDSFDIIAKEFFEEIENGPKQTDS